MIGFRLAALLFLPAMMPAPLAIAQTGPNTASTAIETSRRTTPIDAGWRFLRGDPAGAAEPGFDDSGWAPTTLPHTYNGADGDDGDGYYRGPGWYRRSIALAAVPRGRRVYLQFDGAALATDVYVNGAHVGRHEGGHARFRFDVTGALREGDNLIAVRVDNSRLPNIAPLGGDFTVFGGLYRRVFLVEADDLQIDLLDHGGPGVYVATHSLDDSRATAEAVVRLRNAGTDPARGRIELVVRDAEGRVVARAGRAVRLGAGGTSEQRLPITIEHPRRWQGRQDPYFYSVTVELRGPNSASAGDAVTVPLGLRSAQFDPDRGFLLNGQPYQLHGVNLFHSGRPGRGLAVTDDEVKADVQTLDELGATGVRFVHFQHPQAAYEEADRRGLVVWTEIGLNGVIDPGEGFAANVAEQMRELVRQNYNHPSVVLWGLGNEVYATTPDVTRVLRTVQAVAKQEDPGRPTVYAHCCQSDDHEKARVSDVIAFNRYFGWYPDQKGTIGDWADGYHAANPGRTFVVGEYGAGASIRHQQLPAPDAIVPSGGWHPEQKQTAYHEANWKQLAARPYLGGTFIWVAFDLASDGRREGDRPGINDKGLVSYDRLVRKDAFYWYQANWSSTPMIHIADRRLTERHTPAVEVKAYTNAPEATLTLNGRSLGTVAARDRIVRWNVTLEPGRNRIAVGAGSVSDAVEWTLTPPSSLVVTTVPELREPPKSSEPPKAPPGQ